MIWFALIPGLVAPIVGGGDDQLDTAVVEVVIAGGQCSGVVVAPRVVLTAAHCVTPGAGTIVDFAAVIDRVWVDRADDGSIDHDIAALHLDRDAPMTPLVLAAPVVGPVQLVGFGATTPLGPRGTRHAVAAELFAVADHHVLAGGAGATSCIGDSGGAALDGSGHVVGIIVAGDDACAAASQLVRPDTAPRLAEVIAAWSGPCPADGVCIAGCGDPDCDPCDFEGTCVPTCGVVDLDCPRGGGAGDSCTTDLDCEARRCVPVREGAGFGSICSAPCSVAADCPMPLDTCAAGDCVYATTPGVAGSTCERDAECRSGPCDPDARACTAPCSAGDACPAGFTCEPVRDVRACTPGTGLGCSTGSGGFGFGLVVLGFAISRRRRFPR